MNFWQSLPRPFTALAPLDGVTDVVFRQIVTEIGKPDVLFTEFTPCEGLVSKGRERVIGNFRFTPEQKPIVAQIWGTKPEQFYTVAKELSTMGFAGIDINMGCPERTVVKNGACSALIKNPSLAAEIIKATKEGAGRQVPVSVKTRIGFSKPVIEEWLGFLLQQKLAALTVHLRTVAEMSAVDAHWEMMPEVVDLKNTISPETILIGNGDIVSLDEALEKFEKYGCDGFMIGRGVFANPWVFNRQVTMHEKTVEERVGLYLRHIELFEKEWQGRHNFALLKKFGKTYVSNFDGASELRVKLMESKKIEELKEILLAYTA
jgi:tRNA-dihydrouridine synthase